MIALIPKNIEQYYCYYHQECNCFAVCAMVKPVDAILALF